MTEPRSKAPLDGSSGVRGMPARRGMGCRRDGYGYGWFK